MIRLLISGFSGFMGSTVRKIAEENPNFEVVGGVDRIPFEGYPVFPTYNDINIDIDVIIDFGAPTLTDMLLSYCERTGTPAIICTTGLTQETKDRIPVVAQKAPLFYSANMSFGANLLAKLSRYAASMLADDFDIEIVEAHHRRKLDAPSGTALMLADEVKDAIELDRKNKDNPNDGKIEYCHNRSDRRTARPKNEIGIHAIRGGNIVGDHEVMFISDSESVSISHRAFSREVFAAGSIKAAMFLHNKPAGLYSMNDLIVL